MSLALNTTLAQLQAIAKCPMPRATAMPKAMYVLPEILAKEEERIFAAGWLCAGRADELTDVGDYMKFEHGRQPVIIFRGGDGTIQANANVCRHRMMRLVDGRGNARKFTCPYHAWTYDLDGQLVAAPFMDKTECFNKADLGLHPVRCEIYQGWIYLSLDPNAEPVADALADLTPIMADYTQEDYVTIFAEDHVWDTNWKCLTKNFMESYHLPVAHKATVGAHQNTDQTSFDPAGAHDAYTYQLLTKRDTTPVGCAHPNNTRLKGRWRNTSVMLTVFPSHMYVLAPDHLWYLALQPDGVGRTRIRYGAAIAPEMLPAQNDRDGFIADTKAFLDQVQIEDKHVVEGMYRGAQSPLGGSGPLSWLERANHEFTQYLARRLCDNGPCDRQSG